MGKMLNYLNQMAKTTDTFYNEAMKIAKNIAKNNGNFLPEIAQRENAAELERLNNLKFDALDDISFAEAGAFNAAEQWGALSAKELTDDAEILKLFNLSPEQFAALVDKYRDNGTMSQLLMQYAEKENKKRSNPQNLEFFYYDVSQIPTVEAKKEAFRRFSNSARDLINRIAIKAPETTGANTGLDTEFFKIEVEGFGKENMVNSDSYRLL